MKIAFYLCEGRDHPNNVIRTAYDNCPFEKDIYWLNDFDNSHLKYDAHVTWGMWKKANPATDRISRIAAYSPKHIILEMGYIERGKGPDDYYSVNIGGLNNWGKDYELEKSYMQPHVRLKPLRSGNKLIIGQVTRDSTVQHHNHIGWLQNQVELNPDAWLRS